MKEFMRQLLEGISITNEGEAIWPLVPTWEVDVRLLKRGGSGSC